jgi:hypothetical protein
MRTVGDNLLAYAHLPSISIKSLFIDMRDTRATDSLDHMHSLVHIP